MFLDPWSLALTLGSGAALLLLAVACRTAVRVLRFWDPGSDSNLQIRLESEIWLSSTLVSYGLGVQILSLLLFVLAADHFCGVLPGAMCATGSLLANPYGMPALALKLAAVFFYSSWILLHQLDIRSEHYPLVRGKYLFLLFLFPLLLADLTLQTLYIAGLEPDIITSCCGMVFGGRQDAGSGLWGVASRQGLLAVSLVSLALLAGLAVVFARSRARAALLAHAALWCFFFPLALLAVTRLVSAYVYAMPAHDCPFCLLKPEYGYFGLLLYGTLLPAAFFGISPALAELVKARPGLREVAARYQERAVRASLRLLLAFVFLAAYYPLRYLLAGGEG